MCQVLLLCYDEEVFGIIYNLTNNDLTEVNQKFEFESQMQVDSSIHNIIYVPSFFFIKTLTIS